MKAMREAACSSTKSGRPKKKVEKIMEEADDGQVGAMPKGGPLAGKTPPMSRMIRLGKKKK